MISVFGSKVDEREIGQVADTLRSQWLGFGNKVEVFEKEFSSQLKLDHFLMVNNGSNALYLAATLLNLPPQSEIILPSFTWVACAQAIILAGHKPVFCDVDLHTMNVTAETVAPHITPKTGAIMVVHYAGLPCEMRNIMELGLPIIEDAAHAVDSKYHGIACGAISDIGIYSFDAVKNLTAGEGGGITMKNPAHFERAKKLRYCGIGKSGFENAAVEAFSRWWEYTISEPFIKMLPNNISASIAIEQLKKLEDLQKTRKMIWSIYQSELSKFDWIISPIDANNDNQHSYFTYCIRVKKCRDTLARYLYNDGVYTTLRYHPLHMNATYCQTDKYLKNCEQLNLEALNIPLHPNMSLDKVDHVISAIHKFSKIH